MPDFLQFWGKAAGARFGEPATHPAAYHGLDVAASAGALLDAHPRRLAQLGRLLGTSSQNAHRLICALIALHDIGKFAEAFQGKVTEAWPVSALGPVRPIEGPHHTATALDLFERLQMAEQFAPAFGDANWSGQLYDIWACVACHHGKPMQGAEETYNIRGMRSGGIAAATAYANQVVPVFGHFEPLEKPDRRRLAALSWMLAGLTNIADWIGSNRSDFPYREPTASLSEYWFYAQQQAVKAVAASGISPVISAAAPSLGQFFPAISSPSPLQSWAQQTDIPDGPVLAIIEDVTGSGKTEAALLLAARLMDSNRAGGVFFALPTMATANAMFGRLSESYRRMFEAGIDPSLVLAHGRSGLHKGFE